MKVKVLFVFIAFLINLGVLPPTITAAEEITETALAAGYDHCLGLNSYGRVYSAGNNDNGQCNTYGWKNVTAIAAGQFFSAGLLSDGTVITAGGAAGYILDTSGWTGIQKIVAGDSFLAGRTVDGNVLVTGKTDYGTYTIDTSEFSNIEEIAAGSSHLIGLRADRTCMGTGNPTPSDVSAWTGVVKIFAGADVSVALLESGTLIYAGFPYTRVTNENEGSVWAGSTWTGVKEVILVKTNNLAATIGIMDNGEYKTDDPENRAVLDFSDIQNAKQTVIGQNPNNTYSLVLHDDNTITVKGNPMTLNPYRWLIDINSWKLDKEPLTVSKPFPIMATGGNTTAFVLPSGKLRIIGNTSPDMFYGDLPVDSVGSIVYLDSTIENGRYRLETYLAIDNKENVITNGLYDFNDWNGVQKVSTSKLGNDNILAVGLRWDGKAYSTLSDDTILNYTDIIDVASGNFYSAALRENKTVISKIHSNKYFSTLSWTDIEKIFPGYRHLVGIKSDRTVVVSGNPLVEHDVSGWSDIVDAACGFNFSVGLKSNGTCVSAGTGLQGINYDGINYNIDVSSWKNINKIYAGFDYVIGYTNDGHFLFSGNEYNVKSESIVNTLLKETLFINTTKNMESTKEKLILGFSQEGLDAEDTKMYVAVYDSEGNLVYIKNHAVNGDEGYTEYIIENLPQNAVRWKLIVWKNYMKPIYLAEGDI